MIEDNELEREISRLFQDKLTKTTKNLFQNGRSPAEDWERELHKYEAEVINITRVYLMGLT
jgi:hypothetical protein